MEAKDIKAFFREKLEGERDSYARDLEAMPDEHLAASPGGQARTAYDFTHEVAYVNKRIAKRLRGEDPGPPESDGWIKASPETSAKAAAIENLNLSMHEVIAAWDALPESDLNKTIVMPSGETTPMKLAYMCAHHTGYHDAQLNYLQSINGDMEVHWA